jgi:hypothetical protein
MERSVISPLVSGSKEVFSLIKLAADLRQVNFGGQRLG